MHSNYKYLTESIHEKKENTHFTLTSISMSTTRISTMLTHTPPITTSNTPGGMS